MGVHIYLISKNRQGLNYISQGFENLMGSYDHDGESSELGQIGIKLNLNLNKIFTYPQTEPYSSELDEEYYQADISGDKEWLKAVDAKYKTLHEEWGKIKDSVFKGWLPVNDFIKEIQHLKHKLKTESQILSDIEPTWFTVKKEYFTDNTKSSFFLDLNKLISICLKFDPEDYVGFEWG